MAHGTDPAARRRESREHPPTLGRDGTPPLGLSTGGQSEDEPEDEEEDDAAGAVDEDEDEDEDDESDEDDVEVDEEVEDFASDRLSVR